MDRVCNRKRVWNWSWSLHDGKEVVKFSTRTHSSSCYYSPFRITCSEGGVQSGLDIPVWVTTEWFRFYSKIPYLSAHRRVREGQFNEIQKMTWTAYVWWWFTKRECETGYGFCSRSKSYINLFVQASPSHNPSLQQTCLSQKYSTILDCISGPSTTN